jgi:hypothetical protein
LPVGVPANLLAASCRRRRTEQRRRRRSSCAAAVAAAAPLQDEVGIVKVLGGLSSRRSVTYYFGSSDDTEVAAVGRIYKARPFTPKNVEANYIIEVPSTAPAHYCTPIVIAIGRSSFAYLFNARLNTLALVQRSLAANSRRHVVVHLTGRRRMAGEHETVTLSIKLNINID